MPEIKFEIRFNPENGGVDSLVNTADPYAMNWLGVNNTWGTVKNAKVVSVTPLENGVCAVYETYYLRVKVKRELCGEIYRETYTLENRLAGDVFCNRGDFGIYAPFRDSYANAKVCMTERCNTHLWCGRNTSHINAVKMGLCGFGLGLVLTEGSLDSYSIDRVLHVVNSLGDLGSDDRGDFILHPAPFRLKPGESVWISWEMFWYKDGCFLAELEKRENLILVDSDNFTVFDGEKICFCVNHPGAVVSLDGKSLPTTADADKTYVSYVPERLGDHLFTVRVGERETVARFFVQLPLKELIRRRVHFIIDHQQFHSPGDMLDGAFLIYDNQDKCQVFDYVFTDFNASRERLVMGLLVAKYLQWVKDDEVYEKFMKYYRFVTREFYDEETGEVYNNVGKHTEFKRLYNAPWMSVLVLEMYHLTGDKGYLEKMFKLLSVYYSIGGERFYPNGLSVYESVTALRQAGMTDKADALTEMYKKHAEVIMKNSTNYPEHEVKYEQTIVAPAVTILSQLYMLTEDKRLLKDAGKHIKILERFNGMQPSHFLHDQAIRHWDGYWFGKRRMYGDTFPHSASVHTSNAFLHYAAISGDRQYRKRAFESARNMLSLYREDGSASCTYLYPFSVNGTRCEFYDDYANEQDGLLYYFIKFYQALADDPGSENKCLRTFDEKGKTERKPV